MSRIAFYCLFFHISVFGNLFGHGSSIQVLTKYPLIYKITSIDGSELSLSMVFAVVLGRPTRSERQDIEFEKKIRSGNLMEHLTSYINETRSKNENQTDKSNQFRFHKISFHKAIRNILNNYSYDQLQEEQSFKEIKELLNDLLVKNGHPPRVERILFSQFLFSEKPPQKVNISKRSGWLIHNKYYSKVITE